MIQYLNFHTGDLYHSKLISITLYFRPKQNQLIFFSGQNSLFCKFGEENLNFHGMIRDAFVFDSLGCSWCLSCISRVRCRCNCYSSCSSTSHCAWRQWYFYMTYIIIYMIYDYIYVLYFIYMLYIFFIY